MPRDQDKAEPLPAPGKAKPQKPREMTSTEKRYAEEAEWEQVPGAREGIQRNSRTGMWRNTKGYS